MGAKKTSEITFDTTTLEKIVSDSQWVLDNEEEFWTTFRAQILTQKWADNVKYDIDREWWRNHMQEWTELSQEERDQHTLMKITQGILAAKEEFSEKALPHDSAFLPEGVDLSVTVQFTAFVPPFAFAMEDNVIDVASPYWKGKPEHILNLLVHELFHVGYSHYRTLQSEKGTIDDSLYAVLDNIVNEGICTYVGHAALHLFPVEADRDYVLIENPDDVVRMFADTNEVLSQFGKIPADDLQKLSWEKGVMGRAYYVAGAVMAQTIDERKGRQALIDVYSKGPISIIKLYNKVADKGMEIYLPL